MESRALAVALVSLGPWGVGAEFSLSHAECQVETSPAGSTSLMHVRNTSVYVQVCMYTRIYWGAGRPPV